MPFIEEPDIASLSQVAILLRLFNHRNKNQHRRSTWWRHFSTLQRQLKHLEHDVENLTATPKSNVERIQLKAQSPAIRERISHRLQSWPIAKWQHAFSQLVADGRFAHLGLVLLAALARVCAITDITTQLEQLGENEIQHVLADFELEHWRDDEDLGAAIAREDAMGKDYRVLTAPQISNKSLTARATADTANKRPRAKRKRDAIDILFDDE